MTTDPIKTASISLLAALANLNLLAPGATAPTAASNHTCGMLVYLAETALVLRGALLDASEKD